MSAPATFRELAKAQERVNRAVRDLSPADRRRVLEASLAELVTAPTVPAQVEQCEAVNPLLAGSGLPGARCVLYSPHTGKHSFEGGVER